MYKFLFHNKIIICPYMFRALKMWNKFCIQCSPISEKQCLIKVNNLRPFLILTATCKWSSFDVLLTVHLSIILVINQLNAQNSSFIISLLFASTCFEHYVIIIRRSKFCYTASGIITLCRWPSRAQVERGLVGPVHRTATYRCADTRSCIIQFWPPDDEHIVLETCRGI